MLLADLIAEQPFQSSKWAELDGGLATESWTLSKYHSPSFFTSTAMNAATRRWEAAFRGYDLLMPSSMAVSVPIGRRAPTWIVSFAPLFSAKTFV